MVLGRCLAGISFLFKFWREDGFWEVLSRIFVSCWVCTRRKIVFLFISSFLAGKEAKEAGGTYEWFPLDPLSTFDRGKAKREKHGRKYPGQEE